MTEEVSVLLTKLRGEPCTRREVGRGKSLSLGFGEEAEQTTIKRSRAYRLWEIGTLRSAWRILKDGVLLCGSRDTDEPAEANKTLAGIELGGFSSLRQLTELDVRVELDNGVAIEFFTAFSDDDETFYISCPGKLWVKFSAREGWQTGPSDQPWSNVASA